MKHEKPLPHFVFQGGAKWGKVGQKPTSSQPHPYLPHHLPIKVGQVVVGRVRRLIDYYSTKVGQIKGGAE